MNLESKSDFREWNYFFDSKNLIRVYLLFFTKEVIEIIKIYTVNIIRCSYQLSIRRSSNSISVELSVETIHNGVDNLELGSGSSVTRVAARPIVASWVAFDFMPPAHELCVKCYN